MAAFSSIMMAAGLGLSVLGKTQQGSAQQASYNLQAANDDLLARQEAVAAQAEAGRVRKAGERTAGAARAQFAASGARVDEGSPVDVEKQIYLESEQDAMNVLLTGERKSSSLNRSANASRAAGASAKAASVLSAASSGLQGWRAVRDPALTPSAADPLDMLYHSNRSIAD